MIEIRTPLMEEKESKVDINEKWAVTEITTKVQSYVEDSVKVLEGTYIHISKDTGVDQPVVVLPRHKKSKPFVECILVENHKDEIMGLLHTIVEEKGGKNLGHILHVAVEMGIIKRPTLTQLKSEFNIMYTRNAYEKYYNGIKDMPETLRQVVIDRFSQFMYGD